MESATVKLSENSKSAKSVLAPALSSFVCILCLVISVISLGMCLYYGAHAARFQRQVIENEYSIRLLNDRLAERNQAGLAQSQILLAKNQSNGIHSIRKREATEAPRQSAESVLSRLTVANLAQLRGPPGRDGRDGRDGKSCDDSFTSELQQIIKLLTNRTRSVVTPRAPAPARKAAESSGFDEDEFLQKFNTTVAFGILKLIRSNNEKLTRIEEELATEETSGGQKKTGETSRIRKSSTVIGGSTYVRWGRKQCGNTSQLLYSGLAAGQHYTQTGGASNYQCLPLKPQYSAYLRGDQGTWIYGAEYKTGSNLFPTAMNNHNVPCARCYVPQRSASLMIPAWRDCPDKWTKEYEGYLMAGHHSHKRAYNYACVDKNPEAVAGLQAGTNGALFYFVQGSCSTLGRCPPYIEAAELTCVVCTR